MLNGKFARLFTLNPVVKKYDGKIKALPLIIIMYEKFKTEEYEV